MNRVRLSGLHPWLAQTWEQEIRDHGRVLSTENKTAGKRLQCVQTLGTTTEDGEDLTWVKMGDTELKIDACLPSETIERYNQTSNSFTSSGIEKDFFKLKEWKFVLACPAPGLSKSASSSFGFSKPGSTTTAPPPLSKRVCLRIEDLEFFGSGDKQILHPRHDQPLKEFRQEVRVAQYSLDVVENPEKYREKTVDPEPVYESELPKFISQPKKPAAPAAPVAGPSHKQLPFKSPARRPASPISRLPTTSSTSIHEFDWSVVKWPLESSTRSPRSFRTDQEYQRDRNSNILKRLQKFKDKGQNVDPEMIRTVTAEQERLSKVQSSSRRKSGEGGEERNRKGKAVEGKGTGKPTSRDKDRVATSSSSKPRQLPTPTSLGLVKVVESATSDKPRKVVSKRLQQTVTASPPRGTDGRSSTSPSQRLSQSSSQAQSQGRSKSKSKTLPPQTKKPSSSTNSENSKVKDKEHKMEIDENDSAEEEEVAQSLLSQEQFSQAQAKKLSSSSPAVPRRTSQSSRPSFVVEGTSTTAWKLLDQAAPSRRRQTLPNPSSSSGSGTARPPKSPRPSLPASSHPHLPSGTSLTPAVPSTSLPLPTAAQHRERSSTLPSASWLNAVFGGDSTEESINLELQEMDFPRGGQTRNVVEREVTEEVKEERREEKSGQRSKSSSASSVSTAKRKREKDQESNKDEKENGDGSQEKGLKKRRKTKSVEGQKEVGKHVKVARPREVVDKSEVKAVESTRKGKEKVREKESTKEKEPIKEKERTVENAPEESEKQSETQKKKRSLPATQGNDKAPPLSSEQPRLAKKARPNPPPSVPIPSTTTIVASCSTSRPLPRPDAQTSISEEWSSLVASFVARKPPSPEGETAIEKMIRLRERTKRHEELLRKRSPLG
ncbi:uncharacterized protein JCM6883_003666 [Sporobolomyces salmoneus]|uniref:uncharacterized protein n=1 Tax=Sporobolomyces salmoneus TaxID=183962 RepID=UPI00317BA58D